MRPSLHQSDEPAFPMDGREPVTILMVDDQPSKLLSYEVILQDLGERLVKANSGREALDYLLKGDVAVVLMDVSMPEIDGFELADMMRQHPRFQKTPIIFVSAVHLSDPDRIRGYQSGAVDYISVPVVPEVLRAKVSVFAELHRKKRELQVLNRELEERVAQRSEELRLLNEQLQQRVAELESIMQVLPVGVAVAHGRECETVTGNTALGEMLGSGLERTRPRPRSAWRSSLRRGVRCWLRRTCRSNRLPGQDCRPACWSSRWRIRKGRRIFFLRALRRCLMKPAMCAARWAPSSM